jgi:hypothetical protein
MVVQPAAVRVQKQWTTLVTRKRHVSFAWGRSAAGTFAA